MLQSTATPYTALGDDGPGTAAGYDAGVERGGFSAGEEQNRSESHLSLQGRRKSKRGRGGGRRQQHSDSDTAFGPVVSSEMTRTRVNAAPGRVYAACIGKEIRAEEAAQFEAAQIAWFPHTSRMAIWKQEPCKAMRRTDVVSNSVSQ